MLLPAVENRCQDLLELLRLYQPIGNVVSDQIVLSIGIERPYSRSRPAAL